MWRRRRRPRQLCICDWRSRWDQLLANGRKYDPIQDNWSTDVATTSTCRTSVGVAVLDGYLYAIGGQVRVSLTLRTKLRIVKDGGSCLDLVERYDPINNRWERKASMKTRRLGFYLINTTI